ncbi:hypothetical protein N7478_002396 [Penicillium angulare]|uniref:uncharacterized protein n=1 Tax=Penicillium angulare TaxID=116970 RepID=UPI002542258C|nr:uncharacterized protein N7478_002396 [Penicillium angulare]KAJ5286710.1 hypothetical protein N7478_002396 [Penicillium angulare]
MHSVIEFLSLYFDTLISTIRSWIEYVSPRTPYLSLIKNLNTQHASVHKLQYMIHEDGAGSWPPQASYRDSWPPELQPYHDTFVKLAPLVPVLDPSMEPDINAARRDEYRQRVQKLLEQSIDVAEVTSLLSAAVGKESSVMTNEAFNGFYACISALRHAYRWGTVPVVKIVQEEKIVKFPTEIDVPWDFICQRYGIESGGGNTMSNFHCNFDKKNGRVIYAINGSLPEPIPSAEYNLIYAFTEPERKALPTYYHIVQSIICYEENRINECIQHMDKIIPHLKSAFKIYYEYIVDSKIPYSVFTAYIQGFHGWAAGEIINGEYVEYDGTSGANLVMFVMLDYYLELKPFLKEDDFPKYFSSAQRSFLASIKANSFRTTSTKAGHLDVMKQFETLAKQLRVCFSIHIEISFLTFLTCRLSAVHIESVLGNISVSSDLKE